MWPTLIERGYAALGTFALICVTVVGWLVRRYRKSVARDTQTFRKYVWGTLKLGMGRRFNQALARQFGLRGYASRMLATFPDRLPVPSVHRVTLKIDKAYIRLSLAASP